MLSTRPDADGVEANGHQVALEGVESITVTVTVTSADGSRTRVYRVRFPEARWDPARDPWPHCLRGAVSEGFSLVVYEGGSVEELVACAESRDIVAVYTLHEGVYVSCIIGAPDFVNREFRELFSHDHAQAIQSQCGLSSWPTGTAPGGRSQAGGEMLQSSLAAERPPPNRAEREVARRRKSLPRRRGQPALSRKHGSSCSGGKTLRRSMRGHALEQEDVPSPGLGRCDPPRCGSQVHRP